MGCIEPERSRQYDPAKFDQIFDKFDENNDQFLSKSEMSVLIKKVFKNDNKKKSAPTSSSAVDFGRNVPVNLKTTP